MTENVAVILPQAGDAGPAARMVAALAGQGGRFRVVVLGRPGGTAIAGVEYRPVAPSWRLGSAARRHAEAVARVLRHLRPAVIEVHDAIEVAAHLGEMFRPVPVVLITHTDPHAQRRACDPAARTYLLAQVTRVAAISAEVRARVLAGVHPSMQLCAVLPPAAGPDGTRALADALDALRADALEAWSRTLGEPI